MSRKKKTGREKQQNDAFFHVAPPDNPNVNKFAL
jgi:hypothetical protein